MPFLGGGLRGPKGDTGDTGASGTTTIAQVDDLMSRSLYRDFATLKNLNDHGTGPAITFTRASGATYFDANGELQTAAEDEPRFDHSQDGAARSLGLLIEEARTNSLRNSQAGGSTVGTHTGGSGAGGVLPTNWIWTAAGLDLDVVGTGTEDGLSYIDIRFYGTTNSSSAALGYEAQSQIVAENGQTWSASHYVRTVAGDLTNITQVATQIRQNNSSTQVAGTSTAFTPTASYQRATATTTIADATVDRVVERLIFTFSSGVAIDLTLRIAAPQLELGAFPTSYIPTTTAAATRSVDVAVVESPNFAGSSNNEESTLLGEYIFGNSVPSIRMLQLDNGANDERLCLALTSSSTPQNFGQTGGSTTLASSPDTGEITVGDVYKTGAAFAANNMIAASNGTLGILDSSGAMPAGPLGRLTVSGTTARGHWIRKIAYYPKRLTNALLEQLTT